MSIEVRCPAGHTLKIADTWAGRAGRCPVCKALVQVPGATSVVQGPTSEVQRRTSEVQGSRFQVQGSEAGSERTADDSQPLKVILPPKLPAALAASADALAQIVVPPAVPPPLPAPPLHLDPAAVDRVVAEVADVLSADLRAPTAGLPTSANTTSAPGATAGLSGSTDFGELSRAELAEVSSASTTKAQPDVLPALGEPSSAHLSDQNGAAASADEILSSNRIGEVRGGASDADDRVALQVSVTPRTGYQPDDDKRWTVYYLAGWMGLFSLFSMAPALPYWNLGAAPRWAQAVLLLSLLQLAYVVWVASIPDWTTLWSSMILFTAIAALYGATMTIALSTPLDQALPLDLSDVRRETPMWCAGVMLLSFLLAYLCGRAAWRWRRMFELLHA